ncbi:CPBP family intramembrane metalloprotease [Clostridium sp. CS001]|uniref:CPBP family intramembrane glutamic endopeptidase n=1 Tax=Clostridium sp. CS001 TaxID=2880648 RepID=UPI001CF42B65|nr:type II CAAX endopeptidase family protein [Clostridium sp. CS001]MCB2291455.1 CPBP family intramembrane metalloprotease [Clostridium sp. CS001]
MKYLKMLGRVILYFMIYIFTTFICSIAYGLIYSVMNVGKVNQSELTALILKNQFLVAAVAGVITLGIYVLMFRKKELNLFQLCKFRKLSLKNSSIIILSCIGLAFVSSSLVSLLINKFPSYSETSNAIASNTNSVLGVISVVLIIPIFEEVLFRGLIFNELKNHLNIIIAIILQGAIFALAHGNMLQGIYTFIMGVVIAIVYNKIQSILAPMLFHVLYNLFGSIVVPVIITAIGGYHIAFLVFGTIMLIISLILLFKNNVDVVTSHNLAAEL